MPRTALTTVGLLVVTVLLLIPAVGAHAPSEASAEEQGQASLAGFVPPLVVLESGDRVAWSSLDVGHTFTEGTASAPPSPCVDVTFGATSYSSEGATFTLADGTLQADEDPTDTDPPDTCGTATVAQGVAAMGFYCEFHPWMNGLLVVYDASVTSQAAALTDPGLLLQRDTALANQAT